MFEVTFTESALADLKWLKKGQQSAILEAVEQQLTGEPLTETRNRKPLRPNVLAAWEVRVGPQRVFYDVDQENGKVIVKAVGWKEHNKLHIRGKEYPL